jgi:DNA-cytosine methyltransferase
MENQNGINVLSLFDGISCGRIALDRARIKVNKYFASEIDKHAIKVTQYNWPQTVQLGDVTKLNLDDLPKIDLIQAGSPCQGFSFCGKQLNFNDERSKLFFVFVDILNALKAKNPDIKFLLENVKMKKEYQDVISETLGVQPIKINSALVSAQQRNRLYWTNIPNVTQPEDKGILLKDILENPELVEVDREKSLSLNASYKSTPFKHYKEKRLNQMLLYRLPHGYITEDYHYVDKYPTLCAQSPGTKHKLVCGQHYRTLTPLECERLQTVPDHYTNVIAKTNRYKALGNGWTVDVIAHIFKGLKQG